MICEPVAATWSGRTPLMVPCVPTGMNAGVSNEPWRVVRRPRRARVVPSLWRSSKLRGASVILSLDDLKHDGRAVLEDALELSRIERREFQFGRHDGRRGRGRVLFGDEKV